MKPVVVNGSNDRTVASHVRVADSFFSRLRGLLGTAALPAGNALLLKPCNSVHTVGMRYPIDVVFLDRDARVLKVVPSLPPWRSAGCSGSRMALELPAGTATRTGIEPGYKLLVGEERV